MNTVIASKLKNLPNSAGVYFHKNQNDEIIYVGKAASLKNRVRQYFHASAQHDSKTRALVAEICDTDWIETQSEIDALFLEQEMIKRYKPQYNILLRDDKSVTFVRIGFTDEIPSVTFTKNPSDDGAEYFGPFYSANSVKKAVRTLRKSFPFYEKPYLPTPNNLNYQIGLTPALENFDKNAAQFEDARREYKKNLRKLARYLRGEGQKIQAEIDFEMRQLALEHNFEAAAKKRNQLRNLAELARQPIFSREEFLDISKDHALSQLVDILSLENAPRRIEAFDISHLGGRNVVASMVVFTNGLADKREYRKFKMKLGGNDDTANMREVLSRRFSKKHEKWGKPDLVIVDGGKGQLSAAFEEIPPHITVVGIAKRDEELIIHAQKSGVNLAWFENNLGEKSGVSVRREGEFFIVKLHSQSHSQGHARNLLGENSSKFGDLVKLFQRIRDEAHRFAINYHTTIRDKSQVKNQLEQIAGIGPKTRAKLLKEFGSVAKIRLAQKSEISKIVGENLAEKIKQNL
ncbi:MAG: excinuclease ABC subunit UvrC [bacterium]|nr:excinuclease ABC subunit UvrC [bacterium]